MMNVPHFKEIRLLPKTQFLILRIHGFSKFYFPYYKECHFAKKSAFLMVRKPKNTKTNPYFKEKFVVCGKIHYF